MDSPELFADLLLAGKKRKGSEEAYQKLSQALASPETKQELDRIYHQAPLTEKEKETLKSELALIVPKANLSQLNFDTYFALLPYAKLMYTIEQNGQPEKHAYQLALLLNNKEKALHYLDTFYRSHNQPEALMHEACNFALPDAPYNLEIWQVFCQRFLVDDSFRKRILPQASELEDLIKTASQGKKAKPEEVKKATSEIEPFVTLFRQLEKKHGQLKAPSNRELIEKMKKMLRDLIEGGEISPEELAIQTAPDAIRYIDEHENIQINEDIIEHFYQLLQRYILKKQIALSQLGAHFNTQLSLLMLNAFSAAYLAASVSGYSFFLQHGLTPRSYTRFKKLNRQDDDINIPNIKIDGAALGYPDCYLMKVPVLDELQAVRAACLGKLTNCCQSLSGETGEPCVIHGLTSPYGGFYVLCKGDINHPQYTDEVIAQSWAWRSQNNALVLDSVESAKKDDKTQKLVRDFYDNLAKILVENNHTHKVAIGATSGISGSIGVVSSLNPKEEFIDYLGYCDSTKQLVLYEKDKPFYLFGRNEQTTTSVISFMKKALQEDPIPSDFLTSLGWALLDSREDYLDKAREIAQTISPACEKRFEQELKSLYEKIVLPKALESYEQYIEGHGIEREKYTPLHFAIEEKKSPFALALVLKGDYNNTPFTIGDSVLLRTIEQIYYEPKMKAVAKALIQHGADIHLKDTSSFGGGYTPLHRAISGKHFDVALLLLQKGASIDNINKMNTTPWQTIFEILEHPSAKDPQFLQLVQAFLQKGAPVEATDAQGFTLLTKAIEHSNLDVVRLLLASGADCKTKVQETHPLHFIDFKHESAPDIVFELMKHGVDINLQDEEGNNLVMLMISTSAFSAPTLAKLVDAGLHVNIPDLKGNSPLISAMTVYPKRDKTAFILTLIENGASLNVKSSKGESVLFLAAKNGMIDVVRSLLKHGAQIDEKEKEAFEGILEKNASLREVVSMHSTSSRPKAIVFGGAQEKEKTESPEIEAFLEHEARKGPSVQ